MIKVFAGKTFAGNFTEVIRKVGLTSPEYEKIIPFFYLKSSEVTSRGGEFKEGLCRETKIVIKRKPFEATATGEGVGIVASMLDAMRNVVMPDHPEIGNIFLSDFGVTTSGFSHGSDQEIFALLELSDCERTWVCVGMANDLVEAIWVAISGAVNHFLVQVYKEKASIKLAV